jgi:hypothetical protein
VREIAEIKLKDLEGVSLESAMRMVEGTARSMGVTVMKRLADITAVSRAVGNEAQQLWEGAERPL